mmetsp:Transcript_31341/g.74780  ORF Transcript_31341/g.74780 Transcript_31341/m.74780 type:complete len:371 (+) Transcript_31341:1009-2121(+)
MMAGVQNSSVNQTVELAVRVTATPAAVIPSMAMRTVGSVWKRSICSCLAWGVVDPSMRMYLVVLLGRFDRPAPLDTSSRTSRWWAKMQSLPLVGSASQLLSIFVTHAIFDLPVSLYRWFSTALFLITPSPPGCMAGWRTAVDVAEAALPLGLIGLALCCSLAIFPRMPLPCLSSCMYVLNSFLRSSSSTFTYAFSRTLAGRFLSMSAFILRIMTVDVSIVWSSARRPDRIVSSRLPLPYFSLNSSSSHQTPPPPEDDPGAAEPSPSPSLPRLAPSTESWGHSSDGLASAGVPERRRTRSAALNKGTTYLVLFVLLDLSAWDSSTMIALNMPGRRRFDSIRFTTRLIEQMTTRVEPSRFRISPFPDVMTLI